MPFELCYTIRRKQKSLVCKQPGERDLDKNRRGADRRELSTAIQITLK